MKRLPRARTSRKRIKDASRSSSVSSESKTPVPAIETTPPPAEESRGAVPVVGIGGSAGGLEAFKQLLKALPEHPGMAFVLVPHLDPTHSSAMTELLSHATRMPVLEVSNGMQAAPDTVYVIPPNYGMTIVQGQLQLKIRDQTSVQHMPIDVFLHSLAGDQGRNAIGVILSGTGSDGTLGLTAIKSEGGITFAQDSKSAKYDGMPKSAVAAGCVDIVLPPDRIARELLRLRRHPYVTQEAEEEAGETRHTELNRIFRLLRDSSGVDFSGYKPGTIQRRILRRMALTHCENLADYLRYLRQNQDEVQALNQELLINVTSFFRDPEAFAALETAYPQILRGRNSDAAIRIWVPGCSTGEEAYSHAMALVEFLGEARAESSIQVFGTDVSPAAIRKARAGIYRESTRGDVSPVRLRRFFHKVEGGYQINKVIRDLCVFAVQNVASDPPFSRMNLVSCRNVLIYMGAALQRRVMPVFHYALKPGGFLMVGSSEGLVGMGAELFEAADKKHKIYRKRPVPSPILFGFKVERDEPRTKSVASGQILPRQPEPLEAPLSLQKEADRLLLSRYAPAAVLVSDNLEILQTRGHTSRYLELPSGSASLNLLKMARRGLLFELQDAIQRARKKGAATRKENLSIENGDSKPVNIEVIPFKAGSGRERKGMHQGHNFLVVFEERSAPAALVPKDAKRGKNSLVPARDSTSRQVSELKRELAATKEYLQSVIEAQEANNEELQSATEEVQSANEELQSTNEELQTSKEELESANEELNTVNEEMQHRNQQLAQVNNDLVNFLSSASIPMIMLGPDLSIRRFTPQAESVFGLASADVGRPIMNVKLKVNVPDLEELLHEVILNVSAKEQEIKDQTGAWHRLRLNPYRTTDNRIEGAVLTLQDINALKRFNDELVVERANLEETFRQMPCGLVLAEVPSGKVVRANDQLKEILGYPFSPGVSISNYSAYAMHPNGDPYRPAEWPITRSMKGESIDNEEMKWGRGDGTQMHLSVSSRPVQPRTGAIVGVMAAFFDRTQRYREEALLRESEEAAVTGRLAAALAHEINNPLEALANLVYLLGTENTSGNEARRYVSMARVEVDRIAHISKSLLGLYRGESDAEDLSVHKVVDDVLEVFAPKIESGKIHVVKRYKSDGAMHGSLTEIRQVFLNLVSNALEAMGPGGTLTVRTSTSRNWRSPGVRGIRITMTDTGYGIARELRPMIFEPFFTTKGIKGTGLGLWVSRGIIQRYGGSIRMYSRTNAGNSGTAFSIFLPLRQGRGSELPILRRARA
jgi:two-component system, chemotaxis family, CheB/CheR fusion protein